MKIARSKLNTTALALEDAQTEIRVLIKNAFFMSLQPYKVEIRLKEIITKAIIGIDIPTLKQDAIRSLRNFARTQYALWKSLRLTPFVVAYLGREASKGFAVKTFTNKNDFAVLRQLKGFKGQFKFPTEAKGIPLQRYYQDVWEQGVKPTLDKLMQDVALDPNDYTGRNSLRNLAEMEVRYKNHLDTIAELKERGVKLVIASTHADCSKRCAPHQGKIYSLNGTYGITADGRKYEPLENATDIYYTTKAGRTYKNGLLGFNCRHKLYEFKGQLSPTVSEEQRKVEYTVTLKQRQLERQVRAKRIEALMLKDIDETGYLKAQAQAKRLYTAYRKYSHENERAYYPMRVKI